MIEVLPAILTANETELTSQLRQAEQFARRLQIDFADGQFVPERTVTPETVQRAKPTLPFEAHLMVADPVAWIPRVIAAGAEAVVFHVEATTDIEAAISAVRLHGHDVGIAVNPDTPLDQLTDWIESIDLVTFLCVEPGRQGNPFRPDVIPKIRFLREQNAEIKIEADGGITPANALSIVQAGADALIIGSAIWQANRSPAALYQDLVRLVESFVDTSTTAGEPS